MNAIKPKPFSQASHHRPNAFAIPAAITAKIPVKRAGNESTGPHSRPEISDTGETGEDSWLNQTSCLNDSLQGILAMRDLNKDLVEKHQDLIQHRFHPIDFRCQEASTIILWIVSHSAIVACNS